MKKQKIKSITYSKAKKMAWKAVGDYIKARDGFQCFTCGTQLKPHTMQCHTGHFIRASAGNATYFLEENLHCQCARCNVWLNGNMVEYTLRMIDKYGQTKVEWLRQESHKIKKFSVPELLALAETYKKKLVDK